MYNTEKKKLLLDIFEENKSKSYTGVELVDELRDSMNKATIYRQLKVLEEKKIVRKSFNDLTNTYEYQYASNCGNHLHLKCINCGRIIHLKCSEADLFINHISDTHGFSINRFSSSINGLCKECL